VANPKLSTLADTFGAAALNTTLWNASSASPNVQVDTVLDRVAVSCTTNYYSLASTPWDATSATSANPNGIYARVVPTPVGNGSTETFFEVLLDANNKASLFVSGGVFQARVVNAAVNSTITIAASAAAYDAYSYAWWRIQEVSGSFVFATSPDAYTWTTRATIAYTWAATATKFQFVTGYYATETAGQFAYIDHVNTTTSAPSMPNLNWPLIEDGWGAFWNANGGTQPLDRYVEVSDRTRQTVTVSRGRQYEIDQVRTGEASLTLANTDAALDPTNAAGPWYGHIAPYQPYRRRAQWPATRNVLDQVMATAGDLGGYALGAIPQGVTGPDIFSISDSTGGSFVSSATAWQGSTVMQFSVPNATAGSTRIVYTPRWSALPGQTYTVQLRARNITPATTLAVRAFIGNYTSVSTNTLNFGTPATLTGSATAAWTTFTATFTLPAGAGAMNCGLALDTSAAAATCSIQVDGWQLEKGATATTWTAPGVWFPVYAGWTERWPSSWDMSGTYGVVQPTAVDTFSLLSQQTLSDPLTQEINANSPRFVYKLDDPAGSVAVTDWTGNNPAAQLAVSKYGAGSLVFGSSITATDATGLYTGSSGTVATFNNSNPGTVLITGGATFIKLTSAGIAGPANSGSYSRMLAFKYTGPVPTAHATLWSSMDSQRASGNPSGSQLYLVITSGSLLQVWLYGPTGASVALDFPGAVNVVNGDWHLAIFGYDAASATFRLSLDGTTWAFGSVNPATMPSGLVGDNLGGFVDITVGNGTTFNYKGDLAFAAEFPTQLSSTAMGNLYSAWKSSCSGESTNARYARILRYAGFSGASSLQTGLTASMGPANLDGQDAMSALQAVVDTENGAHFVDRAGTVQFKARSGRYNSMVPMYTFGENTSAGEWPYEEVTLDFDSTHLSNQITVTQESSGQNFYNTDATSIANYFPRTLTRTINSTSTSECQDAAGYLLSRYKAPATRVSSIKLHPSANPALWAVCLSLELGTRVRVMRRPPGLPTIQVDCFAENIQWDFGNDGDAWCTLQCSPADLTSYGVFAAWHTTFATSPSSGVTSITVNASADTTNPLATQLGPGQTLVLGQNTANQETVTVLSVGATSPGWTTAVITLTAATTKAHTAADIICEPLPAGVTDPTTYDQSSRFDYTAFAY
jgi:hypothetical protein